MTHSTLFMVGNTKTIKDVLDKRYGTLTSDYIDHLTVAEFRVVFIQLIQEYGLNKIIGDIKPYHINILNDTHHCRCSLLNYVMYPNFPICIEKDFPVNMINMLKLKYPKHIYKRGMAANQYYFKLEA